MLQAGIGTELEFDTYKQPIERMAAILGIDVNIKPITYPHYEMENIQLFIVGWILDYPDPAGIMRSGNFLEILRKKSWNIDEYLELVNQAGITQDRSLRMELYRRADRILVRDQVVIAPIEDGEIRPVIQIAQPWVKGVKNYPVGGWIPYKYLTIYEDERQKQWRGEM
jgi:ABC-type oligopeptide transport system substrate-binding subunit